MAHHRIRPFHRILIRDIIMLTIIIPTTTMFIIITVTRIMADHRIRQHRRDHPCHRILKENSY